MHRNRTWTTDYQELRTQRNHVLDIQGGDSNAKSINFLNESQNATTLVNNGFTFSRTGTATYTNKLGLIATAAASEPRFDYQIVSSKTNFLKYSQAFTNAYWESTASFTDALDSVTTNPNGFTVNASSLTEKIYEVLTVPTATSRHIHQATGDFTPVVGNAYTMSCYVKQPTSGTVARYVQLALWIAGFGANAYMNFDLQTGTVGTGGTAVTASTIQPAGNGWYRISVSALATAAASIGGFQLGFSTTSNAVRTESYIATTPFRVVWMWGAQFEESAAPTTYIPTTTAFVRVNTTSPLGLLLEPQTRQYCSYTEDQTNLLWIEYNFGVKGGKSTTIAPDGSANGNKLSHTTATEGGIYQLLPAPILALQIGATITASVWVWTESGTATVRINYYSGADNLGTLETVTTTPRRITRTFTLLSTDATSNVTVSMNNTQACVWWGYQVEASKTATSYIPKTATVPPTSRYEDVFFSSTNFSSWFQDGRQGTFLANYTSEPVTSSGTNRLVSFVGTNGPQSFPSINLDSDSETNKYVVRSYTGAQDDISNSLTSGYGYLPGTNVVAGVSWSGKETLLCVNGDAVVSYIGETYSYQQTGFGSLYFNGVATAKMYLKSFKYWVSQKKSRELRQLVNNGLAGYTPATGNTYLVGNDGFINFAGVPEGDVVYADTLGGGESFPSNISVSTTTTLKMRIIANSATAPTMVYNYDDNLYSVYSGTAFSTVGVSNIAFGIYVPSYTAPASGRVEVYLANSPYTVVCAFPYKFS